MSNASTAIEVLMLNGLAKAIKHTLRLQQDPLQLPVSDYRHLLAESQKEKGKPLSYPMVFFSLSQVALAEHANPLQAELQGVYTAVSRNGDTQSNIALVPATFTFDFSIIDNSHNSLMMLVSKWLRSSLKGSFSFDINYDGVKVSLQVIPERSLSIPKKEVTVDEPNHFELSTTFQVNGYLSGDFDEEKVEVALLQAERSGTKVSTTGSISTSEQLLTRKAIADRWTNYGDLGTQESIAFTIKHTK